MKRTITIEHEIEFTPRMLAEAFCDMDDEKQAQFFIECAAVAAMWPKDRGYLGGWYQWHSIGGHLRKCECSTEEAREMVRNIAAGLEPPAPVEHLHSSWNSKG